MMQTHSPTRRKQTRKLTTARSNMWRSNMSLDFVDEGAGIALDYSILVHSHLRWDWVWQRPQQFLSRFAKRHPILFVEEAMPVAGLKKPRAVVSESLSIPNLTVLRTEFPPAMLADRATLDAEQKRLVLETLAGPLGVVFHRPVQWFYDPMAVTAFAGQMNEQAIVYDCMDQLSQFRGAPRNSLGANANCSSPQTWFLLADRRFGKPSANTMPTATPTAVVLT